MRGGRWRKRRGRKVRSDSKSNVSPISILTTFHSSLRSAHFAGGSYRERLIANFLSNVSITIKNTNVEFKQVRREAREHSNTQAKHITNLPYTRRFTPRLKKILYRIASLTAAHSPFNPNLIPVLILLPAHPPPPPDKPPTQAP